MLIQLLKTKILAICNILYVKVMQRRTRSFSLLFAVGLGLSLVVSACFSNATKPEAVTSPSSKQNATGNITVNIGFQKAATLLNALKSKSSLDQAIAASGGTVKWTEFPAGPPMLEAMNVGSIDFGYTGESPPIFAQAAGNPLVYVAYDPWGAKAEAIIVQKNSPIKTVAELKGKKVAFAKGSNANYLVVKALESAGLKYSDIKPAFLTPADARAAFEGGNIDAWAIWDPYLAAAQEATGARTITDATNLAPNRGYYLARKSFVEEHPDVLKRILDEVSKVDKWAASNPAEVAKFLEPQLGIKAAALEVAEKRRKYGVLPLTEEVVAKQQEVADTFQKIKLLPKQIQVKEIVWKGNK
ncbi:MAG: sulfonate ABC transporter substrate-binding protein [Brasilonema angustatum HA4187-MV1]|jgi:sulfonate transport system substrate-binding protein|nr:sulfonate ABC transporter substrate-binding protein [Brasilonema angustatum HA4187-MV1]